MQHPHSTAQSTSTQHLLSPDSGAWPETPAEIAPRRAPYLTRRALVTMQVKATAAEALVRLRRHQCWPSRRDVKLLESPIKRMQLLRLVRYSRGLRRPLRPSVWRRPAACCCCCSGALRVWRQRLAPLVPSPMGSREMQVTATAATRAAQERTTQQCCYLFTSFASPVHVRHSARHYW